MAMQSCLCGAQASFSNCCGLLINGIKNATTAESLMRSRYSAYVIHAADYLVATTHSSQRENHSKEEILHWATTNQWLRLEIIEVAENTVEFKAYYQNAKNQMQVHHEHSRFVLENQKWFYVDGDYF